MPEPTQAEIVHAIAELNDAERESQAADQRRAEADRARKAFWTAIDDGLRLSEWRLLDKRIRPGTVPQSQGD